VERGPKKKRVVVVGAGPAGMEAARVSALRGHDVTLIEKSSRLGGLLPLAALIKGLELEDLPAIIRYLKTQLTKLGVKVRLGKAASPDMIRRMKPDVIFVATGGILTAPDVLGINRRRVMTTPQLHERVKPYLRLFGPAMLGRLTTYYLPIGKTVVVVGGGLHGCETAEFLAKRGRKVTIVEESDKVGDAMLGFRLGLLMDWFARTGVTLVTGAKGIEIVDNGLAYTDRDGARHTLAADTIVPTSPLKANTQLLESLRGMAPELYLIGDARQPGMIIDAVREAYQTARAI